MRFAIPLCGSFCLWRDPLWSYGTKSGLAEKQFFKLRKVFFAHAWTASNPRKINMWVDLGTWNIAFPKNLKKNWGFTDKQFFGLRKVAFSHTLGLLPIHATCLDFPDPVRRPKSPPPGFEPRPGPTGDNYATGALPWSDFAFLFSLFALAAKGWV